MKRNEVATHEDIKLDIFIVYWLYWIVYDVVKIQTRIASTQCLSRKLSFLSGKIWFTFTFTLWKEAPVFMYCSYTLLCIKIKSSECTSKVFFGSICSNGIEPYIQIGQICVVFGISFTSLRIQSTSTQKVKRKRNRTWTNPFEYLSAFV